MQRDLPFDDGTRGRDEGMERAERKARRGDWLDLADAILDDLVARGRPFTTDDVWAGIRKVDVGDPRALGSLLNARARRHEIRKTGRVVPSTRAVCHRRDITVWEVC